MRIYKCNWKFVKTSIVKGALHTKRCTQNCCKVLLFKTNEYTARIQYLCGVKGLSVAHKYLQKTSDKC